MSEPRCYGCGRHPRTCWVMPCLVLEQALARGTAALKRWGKRAGLLIR